ncbi:hypothetical protein NDU88_003219 [Pleurodeles waltl]|uniref:Uncharacterized protein n=1 Tax=Pleurodeles waltl TaxID=8319 RepID=A0AAV7P9F0_PLEWA|nr:hypothetical protein NDU88_003219 [Pleurodeles waltl]
MVTAFGRGYSNSELAFLSKLHIGWCSGRGSPEQGNVFLRLTPNYTPSRGAGPSSMEQKDISQSCFLPWQWMVRHRDTLRQPGLRCRGSRCRHAEETGWGWGLRRLSPTLSGWYTHYAVYFLPSAGSVRQPSRAVGTCRGVGPLGVLLCPGALLVLAVAWGPQGLGPLRMWRVGDCLGCGGLAPRPGLDPAALTDWSDQWRDSSCIPRWCCGRLSGLLLGTSASGPSCGFGCGTGSGAPTLCSFLQAWTGRDRRLGVCTCAAFFSWVALPGERLVLERCDPLVPADPETCAENGEGRPQTA